MNRGFIVWGISIVVILLAFSFFAIGIGWKGAPDECVDDNPNTCFCEEFNLSQVRSGARGIRQPVNTLFNLYAIFTSLIVAFFVYGDRKKFTSNNAPNLIRSKTLVPDLYIFAVLFLGLGSMFFHASLVDWGSVFDGMSMYIYASFLVFYTIRRIWDIAWVFWVGYFVSVVGFTLLHAFVPAIPSFINIGVLVLAYLAFEVYIWIRTKKVMQGKPLTVGFWILALVFIVFAIIFWALSQTGAAWCNPSSFWQLHGLLWHPLAGLMALCLYFYWRDAADPV